jgi:phospholipase C
MNAIPQNIKHVVVLMFENRSFDHVFGAFPGANGVLDQNGNLKPECYNLADPTRLPSPPNPGQPNATFRPLEITPDKPLSYDFNHAFGDGMMTELFGPRTTGWQDGQPVNAPPVTHPHRNCGFVSTNGMSAQAMSYYRYGSLKVLHPLAEHFVLCDNWFCDVPGDTLLNRLYMHAATTNKYLSDNQSYNLSSETIFDQFKQPSMRYTWKMYAPWAVDQKGQPIWFTDNDGSQSRNLQIDSRFLDTIRNSTNTHRAVTEFAADAANNALPTYSFIMCWLPPQLQSTSTDTSMHPDSDIRPGENYLAAIYNCLRNSASWNDTLLIVTFDENGGLYDHVFPPTTSPPQPGVITDPVTGCTFDFTLLGPRIPALFISPWLRKGIAKAQYQNTSILRYIQSLIGAPPLTGRDKDASALDSLFAEFGLSAPRTDCPPSIAGYPGFPYEDGDLSKTWVYAPHHKGAPPEYMAQLVKTYGYTLG